AKRKPFPTRRSSDLRELENQLKEYEEQKEKLQEKAKEKARKIVEQATREAEGVMSELRKMQMDQASSVKEHQLIDAKKRLEAAINRKSTRLNSSHVK